LGIDIFMTAFLFDIEWVLPHTLRRILK
jgi:hypothetical protein